MPSQKFKDLVHFIIHHCRNEPRRLGAIRLNKSLWFIDSLSYQSTGIAVSGETYKKRNYGPVPSHILAALEALSSEGKIVVHEPKFAYDPREYISLAQPETGSLSDDERALAEMVVDHVLGYTASEISEKTHDTIWNAAADGEDIPMCATLASEVGNPGDEARSWASDVASRIK